MAKLQGNLLKQRAWMALPPRGHLGSTPAQRQASVCSFPRARSWDSPGVELAPQDDPSRPLTGRLHLCRGAQLSPRSASKPETRLRKGGTSRVGSGHQPQGSDADWVCHPEGQIKIAWGVPCSEHTVPVRPPQPPAWTAPIIPAAFQKWPVRVSSGTETWEPAALSKIFLEMEWREEHSWISFCFHCC